MSESTSENKICSAGFEVRFKNLQYCFDVLRNKDSCYRKTDNRPWNLIANFENKSIFLYSEGIKESDAAEIESKRQEKQAELVFQPKYGRILEFEFLDTGDLLLVLVSTASGTLGQELYSKQSHPNGLIGMAVSLSLKKVFCCSESAVVVYRHNTPTHFWS